MKGLQWIGTQLNPDSPILFTQKQLLVSLPPSKLCNESSFWTPYSAHISTHYDHLTDNAFKYISMKK